MKLSCKNSNTTNVIYHLEHVHPHLYQNYKLLKAASDKEKQEKAKIPKNNRINFTVCQKGTVL